MRPRWWWGVSNTHCLCAVPVDAVSPWWWRRRLHPGSSQRRADLGESRASLHTAGEDPQRAVRGKIFQRYRSRLLFWIFKKIVTAPYLIHGDKIATISWCFFKHPSSLLASCSEKKLESLSDVKQVSKLMNSDVFEFPGRSLQLVLFLLCWRQTCSLRCLISDVWLSSF